MDYMTFSILVGAAMILVTIGWFLNLLGSTASQRANMGRFDRFIGLLALVSLGFGAWASSNAGDDFLSIILVVGFGITLSQLARF